jgi:hypothetical protein
MINIGDIKIFLGGIFGNSLIFISNLIDLQISTQIFCHIAVSGATIYFMYRNHNKKK